MDSTEKRVAEKLGFCVVNTRLGGCDVIENSGDRFSFGPNTACYLDDLWKALLAAERQLESLESERLRR